MALTAPRRTPQKYPGTGYSRAVAAGARIFQGGIVCLSATGFAIAGTAAATLKADGMAKETIDNREGADGALRVEIERGVFPFGNSAGADEVTIADIGMIAFVVDDETVARTDGGATRSAAGRIEDVDAVGVWVRFG